jgi:hypothetical protein
VHIVDPDWRYRFLLASEAVSASERNRLNQLTAQGRLIRVARGVYLDPLRSDPDPDVRFRDRVRARALIDPDAVFGHASAAALWRLPRIAAWPQRVDLVGDRASGGRSTSGARHHRVGRPAVTESIDGIRVTDLARTIADLATSESILDTLVAADRALAGIVLGSSTIRLERRQLAAHQPAPGGRGASRFRFVLDFADGRAESPGETWSRLTISRAGLPAPRPQYRVDDAAGAMFADFAWPDHGVLGEFDGVAKYVREEFRAGRSVAEVVIEEKRREDRLRAAGWRVARWGWDVARSVPGLRRLLMDAGVR